MLCTHSVFCHDFRKPLYIWEERRYQTDCCVRRLSLMSHPADPGVPSLPGARLSTLSLCGHVLHNLHPNRHNSSLVLLCHSSCSEQVPPCFHYLSSEGKTIGKKKKKDILIRNPLSVCFLCEENCQVLRKAWVGSIYDSSGSTLHRS